MNATMDMDDPALTAWLAAARAVHFTCCLLITGVWVFDRLVLVRPVPGWKRAAVFLLAIATPMALISGAVWFALVAANMSDSSFMETLKSPEIDRLVWTQTRFGHAWQVHLLFWFLGATAAAGFARGLRTQWIALLSGAGLVAGLALSGHGSTGPAPVWHMVSDVVHLLVSCVWPAGLIPLAIVLRDSSSRDNLAAIVRRFSTWSTAAVGLIVLSGTVNSWLLVGTFHALFDTRYGQVLVLKILFFVGMVLLGGFNRLRLMPRINGSGATARLLWWSIIFETALAAGVLAAVGLLGLLEPSQT
jgi:putative copper resistance protein D